MSDNHKEQFWFNQVDELMHHWYRWLPWSGDTLEEKINATTRFIIYFNVLFVLSRRQINPFVIGISTALISGTRMINSVIESMYYVSPEVNSTHTKRDGARIFGANVAGDDQSKMLGNSATIPPQGLVVPMLDDRISSVARNYADSQSTFTSLVARQEVGTERLVGTMNPTRPVVPAQIFNAKQ